jgi:hypothetical protein
MSDEIRKIKAIVKLSSAIGNIDDIAIDENKEFSGKLRRDLVKFTNWFAHHTSQECTNMSKAHEEAYMDAVYFWVDGINDYVEASSLTKKHLSLFYCKAVSAIQDLKGMETIMQNKIFYLPIITRLNTMLARITKKVEIVPEDLVRLRDEVTVVVDSVIIS